MPSPALIIRRIQLREKWNQIAANNLADTGHVEHKNYNRATTHNGGLYSFCINKALKSNWFLTSNGDEHQ